MSPVPAAILLAGLASAALLADHTVSVAVIAGLLLATCLRASGRRALYLGGTLVSALAVLVVTPLVEESTTVPFWTGPTLPVLGTLDISTAELRGAAFQALRLAAVGLAFTVYALFLDHDRLVQAAGVARRSALAVALATRLVPTLERDGVGLVESLRGRGVDLGGVRGRALLVSPLVAGSLERSTLLAEAMEARGFGRPGRTRLPSPPWSRLDRLAVALAGAAVVAGAQWL